MKYFSLVFALVAFIGFKTPTTVEHIPISPKTAALHTDELTERIKRAANRIVHGTQPTITEDFLLAGLTLDPKFQRRFTNFSGDQCGRYLSAFAGFEVEGNPVNMQQLVKKILALQKSDGRFGSEALDFKTTQLEGEHMALLWGNGRLLNGLMDYYAANPEPAVLQSAIKLGEFLIGITENCIQPQIIEEFKTKGAMGFICFTQNIEGLVKLYKATNNKTYIELAQRIYPLLPEMGNQHSHGYLNTLRGILMLYEITKKPEQLAFVTSRYKEVLESDSYLISGGVPEFFGSSDDNAGHSYRDEGCSEADWLMLSLELWRATGETPYLDKAEYCLMNSMFFNQFDSGDFGHHHIDANVGYTLAKSEGRAWWCCTYHGLQALRQAQELIVTKEKVGRKINLFYDASYQDEAISFTFNRTEGVQPNFLLTINQAGKENVSLLLRKPYWAKAMTVKVNNQVINTTDEAGNFALNRVWKLNDKVELTLEYAAQFIDRIGKTTPLENFTGKLEDVALQYGPYLMSVDDGLMPAFMAEPSARNVIFLADNSFQFSEKNPAVDTRIPDGYLTFAYQHDGFYEISPVVVRPLSELSHQRRANVRLWFTVEKL